LILVQQPGLRTHGCVSAAPGATTFEQRVPLLTGPDDPLIAVVETLIQVADSRSRHERATLLVDRLVEVDGLSAVPLLSSLRLRADWAATDERAYAPLARLARDERSAIRGAALEVLREILATRHTPNNPQQLDGVAEALREILNSNEANTSARLAALESLGHLLALNVVFDWAPELLIKQLNDAATHAERGAAVTALSRIANPDAVTAVMNALAGLPLDETPDRESRYAQAAVRIDAAGAERVLPARLKRSIAARQSLEAEIVTLGRMRSKESLPLLLAAANQHNLSNADRRYLAWALGRMGDERAVSTLVSWLRRDDYQVKDVSLEALKIIDSPAAARESRPLLKSEPHVPYKLRLARLLARHDMADGYALATEYLSDVDHTAAAALVLAALGDPRMAKDLSAILPSRPDRRWHAAALVGLVTIGNPTAVKQVREILTDDRHSLAVAAAEAAGLAVNSELLLPLAKLAQSRNKQVAMATLVALRRYLSVVRLSPRGLAAADTARTLPNDLDRNDGEQPPLPVDLPPETGTTIAGSVASLVTDAYVDSDVRHQAFAVARHLGGERYTQLLADIADQAELEGTPLLAEVLAERRRLK
jgi:HEAT repeat protein